MAEIFDRDAGQFVCDFVEQLPTTSTGKPFSLYDWEIRAIMDFYGTKEDVDGKLLRKYWYLYLEIPKKNGKSELAAALGLYHLFADGELNAEVYICAADKDQAAIIFNNAHFMLKTAPWTAKMIARGELNITESRRLIEFRRQQFSAAHLEVGGVRPGPPFGLPVGLGVDGGLAQRLRNVLVGACLVAAQIEQRVRVAGDGFPRVLIQLLDLRHVLDDGAAGDVA